MKKPGKGKPSKALTDIIYSIAKLEETMPVKRLPLKTFVQMYLRADQDLTTRIQKKLPPNGRTGRSSFDQLKAVEVLQDYDLSSKGADEKVDPRRGHQYFKGINESVLWKALQDVLKGYGIMSYGQLIAHEAVSGDELDDSIEQDDNENDVALENEEEVTA